MRMMDDGGSGLVSLRLTLAEHLAVASSDF